MIVGETGEKEGIKGMCRYLRTAYGVLEDTKEKDPCAIASIFNAIFILQGARTGEDGIGEVNSGDEIRESVGAHSDGVVRLGIQVQLMKVQMMKVKERTFYGLDSYGVDEERVFVVRM